MRIILRVKLLILKLRCLALRKRISKAQLS